MRVSSHYRDPVTNAITEVTLRIELWNPPYHVLFSVPIKDIGRAIKIEQREEIEGDSYFVNFDANFFIKQHRNEPAYIYNFYRISKGEYKEIAEFLNLYNVSLEGLYGALHPEIKPRSVINPIMELEV